VATVCFVRSMDVVAFVTLLTSSSVSMRVPPIAFILSITAVAFEAPVIIVPTDWPPSNPPPSSSVDVLNIIFISSLIGRVFVGIQSVNESRGSNRVSVVFRAPRAHHKRNGNSVLSC
jgi:hypothetical protein